MENLDLTYLCRFKGGSHLYGLNTPESDIDYRGVFINTEYSKILGLERFDETNSVKDEDYNFFEVRHFLNMCQKSNSQAIEILFMEDHQFDYYTVQMDKIRQRKDRLVDSERLFKSLLGYMEGEKRLASGERKGKEGGKRWEAIQKYGFSPKNFVQIIRLARAGAIFFESGNFPANISYVDKSLAQLLLEIKTEPQSFTKEDLNGMVNIYEDRLKSAFNNRKQTFRFDSKIANSLLYDLYMDIMLGEEIIEQR